MLNLNPKGLDLARFCSQSLGLITPDVIILGSSQTGGRSFGFGQRAVGGSNSFGGSGNIGGSSQYNAGTSKKFVLSHF